MVAIQRITFFLAAPNESRTMFLEQSSKSRTAVKCMSTIRCIPRQNSPLLSKGAKQGGILTKSPGFWPKWSKTRGNSDKGGILTRNASDMQKLNERLEYYVEYGTVAVRVIRRVNPHHCLDISP